MDILIKSSSSANFRFGIEGPLKLSKEDIGFVLDVAQEYADFHLIHRIIEFVKWVFCASSDWDKSLTIVSNGLKQTIQPVALDATANRILNLLMMSYKSGLHRETQLAIFKSILEIVKEKPVELLPQMVVYHAKEGIEIPDSAVNNLHFFEPQNVEGIKQKLSSLLFSDQEIGILLKIAEQYSEKGLSSLIYKIIDTIKGFFGISDFQEAEGIVRNKIVNQDSLKASQFFNAMIEGYGLNFFDPAKNKIFSSLREIISN